MMRVILSQKLINEDLDKLKEIKNFYKKTRKVKKLKYFLKKIIPKYIVKKLKKIDLSFY